ncbi:hypothetical protein LCGC14_0755440 [marine sediment metagenome]|uniref:Transcription regulator TrmB N-terminal domain-containing protein n=1 Tax=marine sediment metagenome TaxID=412755 RepID=A0A0F9SMX8_9ZZZZ
MVNKIRIGKSELEVLKILYKINEYTTSKYISERSKIPKNQTAQILKNLKKKGLVKLRKRKWYLTKKGKKAFIDNFNIY